MTKEKLELESAFPIMETKDTESVAIGVSKRFYAACAAMQGMLSNSNPDLIMWDEEKVVGYAYKIADELLKQEGL